MKHKIIKIKNLIIDISIQKVYNGFEFTPIEICKFKVSTHEYITIKISLIKLIITICFVWNGKK